MNLNLREIRRRKDITQEKLSEMSGVSRATISYLETGVSVDVTVGTLTKLASALDVEICDLFSA